MQRKSRIRRDHRKPNSAPDKKATPGFSVRVFLKIWRNRKVMEFHEAVSWAEDRSRIWFGRKLDEAELRELYRQGKSQLNLN